AAFTAARSGMRLARNFGIGSSLFRVLAKWTVSSVFTYTLPNAALHLRRGHRDGPQPPHPTPRRQVQAFVRRCFSPQSSPAHPALLTPPPLTGSRPRLGHPPPCQPRPPWCRVGQDTTSAARGSRSPTAALRARCAPPAVAPATRARTAPRRRRLRCGARA